MAGGSKTNDGAERQGGRSRQSGRRASPGPTLSDVAKAAGVSRSTASRALTGRGYAAPEVRDRVMGAAERLGYVPDANARSLKERSSRVVGLVVSDLRNHFYAELAAGASQALRERGYGMILFDDGGSSQQEFDAALTFLAIRAAGVLTTPVSGDATTFLAERGMPVVEVDRQFTNNCDAVVVDNVGGARAATDHLLHLGHRRIALVTDETEWTTGIGRLDGYTHALRAAGLGTDSRQVVRCGFGADDAERVVGALLDNPKTAPTALFAVNNMVAEGAWRALQNRGITPPYGISVVGFDDLPWMSMTTPGLTTVAQPVFDLGIRAVDLLLSERREGPRAVRLPTRLVVRGSTGPV